MGHKSPDFAIAITTHQPDDKKIQQCLKKSRQRILKVSHGENTHHCGKTQRGC